MTVEYEKRDKYGNIEHVTARDEWGHVRGATTVFDDEGVFPVKEINALLHETALDYDRRFGLLIKEIDPNQLVTEWQYDSLGRETLEKRPDDSQTTTTLSREKVGETWRYSQRIATTGGADDETIFDSLGRPLRTFSHGPTPTAQKGKTPRRMQAFQYDRLSGKNVKQSVLTAEGTPDDQLLFDVFEFDSVGREIRHTTPWNAATTTTYDGFVIDSADLTTSPPRHTLTTLDELGRPVTITDAAKGKTSYSYGPFNTLRTATDPGGAKTTWTLDAFGRPRSIDDPDRGLTVMKHDGFGDLRESTDALGRVVSFDVDELGRVKKRTDKLGAQVIATTTWTWDSAPNGIGRLHTVTSPDAVQSFAYTKRGQLEGMAQTVEGVSFAARQSYDDVGRVRSIDYPHALGVEPFGVMYEHDEHGFVIGVQEKNTNESFWTLKEVDDAGRIRKERFGNEVETTREYDTEKQTLKGISTARDSTNIQKLGYDWDSRLNLKSRSDALQLQNKTERFRYDELDQVTCAYFGPAENAAAPCVTSYSYMLNGNLWEKSDVGTYTYDPKHPHAVKHVPGETFGYDAVGNQTARPGGISVTYTPFDLPKTITKGGKTTSLGYDGDQKRIRKTSATSETLYFGDIFEQVTSAVGVIERRFYVHSPERAIAVVTHGGAEPGKRFFHVDHLGSIDVITKEDGSIAERRSYDAYGARRNPEWGGPGGVTSSKITKGFTGHEEDDELGLVNMRGRIFDPRLARFTTTDPVIANIWNGQTLNRYGYVNGNPLTFVDPTGFVPTEPLDPPDPYVVTGPPIVTEPRSQEVSSTVYPEGFALKKAATDSPKQEAAKVGAYAPPVDVNTTGNGGDGLPYEPTPPEPKKGSFLEGVGAGLGDFVDDFWSLIPLTPSWSRNTVDTVDRMLIAYQHGDVIDAFNVVNPLLPVANIALAVDNDDWYTVGQAAVGVGVAILSIVVAKKLPGVGKGAKTTRGPPKGAKATSKIDRTTFKAERETFWKAEATANPGNYSTEDLARMQAGKAPKGPDGHPMELHHVNRTPDGGLTQMSRTEHRLGENYKKNHP